MFFDNSQNAYGKNVLLLIMYFDAITVLDVYVNKEKNERKCSRPRWVDMGFLENFEWVMVDEGARPLMVEHRGFKFICIL